jgi:hypothetical protein
LIPAAGEAGNAGSSAGSGGLDASVGGGGGGGKGGASGSGGADGGVGGSLPDASPCTTVEDCESEGCFEAAACVAGECRYEICPSEGECAARKCEGDTCSAEPEAHGFRAYQLDVGAGIGCGGNAQRCIATAGDFVLVGTTSGLRAWRVTNPLEPVAIDVGQPTFVNRLVSNGTRVLVVGQLTAGKLFLAWFDAQPGGQLPKQEVTANFGGTFQSVHPADQDDFFLVEENSGARYPTVRLDLPLADNSTIRTSESSGTPPSDSIVGASGSRLVTYRTDSGSVPVFSFVNKAGTSQAIYAAAQSLGVSVTPALGAHVFTSSYDGSILWATNRLTVDPEANPIADAVLLRWVLSGAAATFDPAPEVVLETYDGYPTDESRAGPSAVIDADKALATLAYPQDTTQTTVRAVLKQQDGTLELAPGTDILTVGKGSIGVAATRRFGLVLLPGGSDAATLRIYAPTCGP